ncbi:MAG: hypothetical protein WAS07_00245 [Micropruina sp.]
MTQDSINATALAFLHSKQPMVNICYVYDDDSNPTQIDYQTLIANAKGADPFNLPDPGSPGFQTLVENLYNAGFMFGFHAAMGLPDGFAVPSLPDVVTLGPTAADPVQYRLLCKNFLLVEVKKAPGRAAVLGSYAQPKGPEGAPWVFTYDVKLVDKPVADNAAFIASAAFGNLPAPTQAKLTGAPNDFTIRQLLFDFANAACSDRPQISGVKNPKLLELLYEDFSIKYFAEMAGAGAAVVAVTPASGDPLSSLQTEFSINHNAADPKLATLNYLCATAGHALPVSKPFSWEWVDAAEANSFDGVCAMNRHLFVNSLQSHLGSYVDSNKWLPDPIYVEVGLVTYGALFGIVPRNHTWPPGKTPPGLAIDVETLTAPPTGELLLHWQFGAHQEYDYLSGTSWNLGRTSFDLSVSCSGNVLTVTQHAVVYCKLVMVTFFRREWNLVDLTITDTFTLAVDHSGALVAQRSSTQTDNSASISHESLVPDLKDRFERAQAAAKGSLQAAMVDVPLSLIDNVIFPGGKGFLFKDVRFSDHQDLIAHVTYADPS